MKKLSFNEWQAHLSKQLELDYKKLYLTPKFKNDESICKIRLRKSTNLR